jgi:phenylacetate-CoA ligase
MKIEEMTILEKLNKTIRSARETQLYCKKNLHELASVKELSTLEFTTKEDLRESYPYGGLAVLKSEVIEVHTTSGTTGKPTLSFFTKKDLENSSAAISEAWRTFGVNECTRAMFIMSYGLYSGATLNTYAIQSLGGFVLPAGINPIMTQVEFMEDFEIDTVIATPGFLLYLYEWLEDNNFDRSRLKLVRAIAAGEVYSDRIRTEIENKLKIKVYDHYGICEVNTGICYECSERKGLHVLDDYILPEIIDPETGILVPDGEYGELVLTSLTKEASPIIRYRTKDITRIVPGNCSCGRTSVRIDRIKSRVGETLFIKGLKIDPYELREFIKEILGDRLYGGDMQIVVKKNDIHFVPKIYLSLMEVNPNEVANLSQKIQDKTKTKFLVEQVDKQFFNRDKRNKVKFICYEH